MNGVTAMLSIDLRLATDSGPIDCINKCMASSKPLLAITNDLLDIANDPKYINSAEED